MLNVNKTIKMYVGGEFIRSESGRTESFKNSKGEEVARFCLASKKDYRNTVEKAKAGHESWNSKTAYNRSQILYRMAEMMQTRIEEFQQFGISKKEVEIAIDTFVYYSGWCDKYQQVLGAVNPVASPYHNFTTPEAIGIVTLVDDEKFNLVNLIDDICSIVVSGNSVIVLLSESNPLIASLLGEVFETSDLPPGTINILTGKLGELTEVIATHMEVQAISFQSGNNEAFTKIQAASVDNMKRLISKASDLQSLSKIQKYLEYKTVWHPIGY